MEKTLNTKATKDNAIMEALGVDYLEHFIAGTSKGMLTLRLNKKGKGKDYQFVLDAVPFLLAENKKLMEAFENVLFNTLN